MKNRNLFFVITTIAVMGLCLPQFAAAQHPAHTTTVSVVKLDGSLSAAVKDALKDATGAIPGVYLVGGVYKIPLAVAAGAVKGKVLGAFGDWLAEAQICKHYKMMFRGCNPPDTGRIKVEITIESGPPPIKIVVEFFAKLEGNVGGRPVGYVAPIGPAGFPTMKLKLGGITLERIACE